MYKCECNNCGSIHFDGVVSLTRKQAEISVLCGKSTDSFIDSVSVCESFIHSYRVGYLVGYLLQTNVMPTLSLKLLLIGV